MEIGFEFNSDGCKRAKAFLERQGLLENLNKRESDGYTLVAYANEMFHEIVMRVEFDD